MFLQVSPLVSLLRDVAARHCREDGWTYLALAGDLAKIQAGGILTAAAALKPYAPLAPRFTVSRR